MDLFSCYFIVEAPALTYNTVIASKLPTQKNTIL
jgi:hypothetical protein